MKKETRNIFLIIILVSLILALIVYLKFRIPHYTLKDDITPTTIPTTSFSFKTDTKLFFKDITSNSLYEATKYIEFDITGSNATDKDHNYQVVLSRDNALLNKIRISDEYLKFKLVEVTNQEEKTIFNNKSYENIENKTIWIETISSNKSVSKTYRLYVYLDNYLKEISLKENLYASVKVNIKSDM